MALEATHIRFALDLKDKYQVKDVAQYVAGAIYPDSRYFSGLDRILTHPTDFMDWHWDEADDFKKGWFVHLLADRIQWLVIKEDLPDILEGKYGQGSEVWIKHTAIKILQDLDDANKFDIKQCFPYLKFITNPNGEDADKIKAYHESLPKIYTDLTKLNIGSYHEMWKEFGIGGELAEKIKFQAEQYRQDTKLMAAIGQIYQKMLNKARAL